MCDFEANKCSWSITTDDSSNNYKWARVTSKWLLESNIPGPEVDYQNQNNRNFMFASDHVAGEEGTSDARTELKSPLFKGNEHPLECFSFWFYFGVSCN